MPSETFNPEIIFSAFSEIVNFSCERLAEILIELGEYNNIEEAKNALMQEVL